MPSDSLELFGQRVREIRTNKGISQEKLASLAEMDRTYVSGIERGRRNVSLLNLLRIAKALDTPPSFLISGIEDAHNE